jgi:pyridoxal phosphate enzyme (YggS family)
MSIQLNLTKVNQRVVQATIAANRDPDEIKLLAVSKTQSVAKIREAANAGQRYFGENYLQTALPKINSLLELNLEWHFIGVLQSNKAKQIAENFAWVHSVDCEAIAARLARYRPASLPPLNICLQVNVDDEASKAGVRWSEAVALAKKMVAYHERLILRGLMAIPQVTDNEKQRIASFSKMQQLRQALISQGLVLDTLSIGMSADLELAIRAGSTLVRVGTAIFGARV